MFAFFMMFLFSGIAAAMVFGLFDGDGSDGEGTDDADAGATDDTTNHGTGNMLDGKGDDSGTQTGTGTGSVTDENQAWREEALSFLHSFRAGADFGGIDAQASYGETVTGTDGNDHLMVRGSGAIGGAGDDLLEMRGWASLGDDPSTDSELTGGAGRDVFDLDPAGLASNGYAGGTVEITDYDRDDDLIVIQAEDLPETLETAPDEDGTGTVVTLTYGAGTNGEDAPTYSIHLPDETEFDPGRLIFARGVRWAGSDWLGTDRVDEAQYAFLTEVDPTTGAVDTGTGNGTVLGSAEDDKVVVDGSSVLFAALGPGDDTLTGTTGEPGAGWVYVDGGDGNDTIALDNAQGGFYGGAGNDTITLGYVQRDGVAYLAEIAAQVVRAGDGDDVIDVTSSAHVMGSDGADDVTYHVTTEGLGQVGSIYMNDEADSLHIDVADDLQGDLWFKTYSDLQYAGRDYQWIAGTKYMITDSAGPSGFEVYLGNADTPGGLRLIGELEMGEAGVTYREVWDETTHDYVEVSRAYYGMSDLEEPFDDRIDANRTIHWVNGETTAPAV